jgi:hypothetical protein
MREKRIADLFQIKTRFLRSAQLERDFNDPNVFSGYVLTEFGRSCLERLSKGLKPNSGQRAWRMTGDYGSGKSSFALLLAHWFAGNDSSFPPQIRKVVEFHRFGIPKPRFIPVLVTCSKQALGSSILKSLLTTLNRLYGRGKKLNLITDLEGLLESHLADKSEPTEDQVLDALAEVNSRIITDSKGRGLMLILDELGKFFEFAALHPQRQDVFLLQRLAETASRSGNEPLFVVCLLHQGFNAYADYLNQSAQREWEKVAGRFDEIVFNQPIEQIASLICSALNVKTDQLSRTQTHDQKSTMERSIALKWFGSANARGLNDLAASLYPLHPTMLPVLIRTFRRFGQNERSLFSFLLSDEPFGLQEFSARSLQNAASYRLTDFYDYVRTNFGHRLVAQSYRSHWNLIDSMVDSFATEDPTQIKILKAVGILNLLNDTDLVPTEATIVCALAGADQNEQKQIRFGIEKLLSRRVLYSRGRERGLCLWPHTSVDLEKAYEEARHAIDTPRRVASLIKDYLETRPIVARRHYIETGNLRHFDVRYCSITEITAVIQNQNTDSDGTIVILLCETEQERDVALKLAKSSELQNRTNWLVAVPKPLNNLAPLVQEVQRWDWVSTKTLELNADKYGREEVSRQASDARAQLERRIQSVIGFKQMSGQMSLDWFYQTNPVKIKTGRHLLEELSRLCDETYKQAPHIYNELLNRRTLSSAAAAARMRLIERMFSSSGIEWLEMNPDKKPPEMSMYLSVLKSTGFHQKHGNTWRINEPDAKTDVRCNVLPTFRLIRDIVQRKPDSRVNIAELFNELRRPPYGLRDGLIPVLLTVFAITHEQDIAFFKDGSFLRELTGEMMLLLTKVPEKFEIQYCKIEGIRAELFEKLLAVMEVKPSANRGTELLDVVKPLCVFVAQLPGYVLNSKKLTPNALAVRDTILNAREPASLLFSDLPKACGFERFSSDATPGKSVQLFVKTLKAAIDELRAAFPELQDRLRKRLRDAFDLPGSFQQFRTTLAGRAQQVVLGVTEPKLKALCLRLLDDNLPEAEWLESLGSYLALKPPSKWHDTEEDLFVQELAELATRFHRVESILFVHGKPAKDGVGIRLAITQANGTEHERVIHISAGEENKLRELQGQFEALLTKDRRLGMAAASRALWSSLGKEGKIKHE